MKSRKPVVTKKQLREEIDALRYVGQQLSNIAFNMGQETSHREIEPRVKAQMRDLQRKWDAIPRSKPAEPLTGIEGQDRQSYTDTQDRRSYSA